MTSIPFIGSSFHNNRNVVKFAITSGEFAGAIASGQPISNFIPRPHFPPGDLRRYGGVLDGIADDTVAFQAAMDSHDVLPWEGTVLISNVTSTKQTAIMGYGRRSVIKLATPATPGTVGTTLANAGSSITGVHINGDNTNRTLVNLTGNNCKVDVTTENVDALSSTETFVSGVDVNANYCEVSIFGDNYTNPAGTGHSNESVPRLVTISDGTTGTYVPRIEGYNINVALIVDGSGEHHFGDIVVEDANDQGVYLVGSGCLVTGNYLEYRGTGTVTGAGDEPIVVSNNGSLHLGHVVVYGQSAAIIGLENADEVHIGRIEIEDDGITSAPAPASLIRTRSGQTASGRCYIGAVTGQMRSQLLMQCSTGTVEYLTIRNLDVDWIYDATNTGTLSQWMQFSSCKGFDFRDWRVKIIDEDDALTTEVFQATAPTANLDRKSHWKNIKIEITDADETTESGADFRGFNLAQALIYVEGAEWTTNIGPYVRYLGAHNGVPNSANQAPAGGTWRAGQKLYDSTPSAAGSIGWVCTVAGAPGTWKTFGTIAA